MNLFDIYIKEIKQIYGFELTLLFDLKDLNQFWFI